VGKSKLCIGEPGVAGLDVCGVVFPEFLDRGGIAISDLP
jgi:hypothetical protein